jgi:predicted transcriptional regulator
MSWKPPRDDGEAMVLAIREPLRRRILATTAKQTVSPKQLEAKFGETLQRVSYHIRCLHFYRLIDQVDRRPARGALQHFYAINDLGRRALVIAEETGMLEEREVTNDGEGEELDR